MNSSEFLFQNVKLGSVFLQFPKELDELFAKFKRLLDLMVAAFVPKDCLVVLHIARALLSRISHFNMMSEIPTHGCAVRLDHLQSPDRCSAEVVGRFDERVALNECLKLANHMKEWLGCCRIPAPLWISGRAILRIVEDDLSKINLKFSHPSQRRSQPPVDTAKFAPHCERQRLLMPYALLTISEDHLSNCNEGCRHGQHAGDKRLIVVQKVPVSIGRCKEICGREECYKHGQRRPLRPPSRKKLTQISPLIISGAAIYQNNQKVSNAA